jgi:hypothetical protein
MGLHVRDNPEAGRVWIENDRGKRVSEIDVENVGPGPGSLGLAHEMASASELLSQLRAIKGNKMMSEAKSDECELTVPQPHTPGPWMVDDLSGGQPTLVILSKEPRSDHRFRHVCSIDWMEPSADDPDGEPGRDLSPQDRANARLIAASPDLLRALKSIVSAWTGPQTDAVWLALAAIDKAEPWAERSR